MNNLIMSWFLVIISFIKFLGIIIPVLVGVAFFTLLERKLIGYVQRRRGPNVVGFAGLLQPFADGLKLLIKEPIIPGNANRYLFIIAPIITLLLSFLGWAIIPFDYAVVYSNINIGILYLFDLLFCKFLKNLLFLTVEGDWFFGISRA